MIKIRLKDGSIKEVEAGKSVYEVAKETSIEFEKQIEQLQDLIGMEDKQYDNSAEPYLPSVGYRWDAENTTLQVAWIKGPGDTSVIFSLGLK